MKLRIMSFNIRNMRANDGANGWEQRRELLREVIRRYQPDILATQEAYLPQVEYLAQTLPEYARVGVGRDDGKFAGEHCAVFFLQDKFQAAEEDTFWFSETPECPGSRHWTPAHPRICSWVRLLAKSGHAFAVYNVHMDHELQFAREQSVRLVLEHIGSRNVSQPVLLTGDFNMEEDNPALRRMYEGAPSLRDTFRLLHPVAKNQGTFHNFTGDMNGERIDFIFASREFEVVEAHILRDNAKGRYPSDHFPISADARLGE